jgi:ferredoxin
MSYKVKIEQPLCIACENCVAIFPESWEMADDGLSHLINSTGVGENGELEMGDVKCNIAAAEGCPVTCIHVFHEGKKLI